jgi:hypothetical protein
MTPALTRRLRGRRVAACHANGTVLALVLEDGSQVHVAWVDENGRRVAGRPVLQLSGGYLNARSLHELIKVPA